MRSHRLLGVSNTLVGGLTLLLGLAATAQAASVTINGSINALDPVMQVVSISTPNCVSQGAFPVHYDALPFTVDVSGSYSFSMTSPTGVGSLYLHQNTFNPAASLSTCVAADNSGDPVDFSFGLTAGTNYIAVPFDDTLSQSGVVYALTISGPGNIIATVPEPASLALLGVALATMLGVNRTRRQISA